MKIQLLTPNDGSLRIRPSSIENGGFGVFALQNFKTGDCITRYYGKILTYTQCLELKNHSHVRSLFAMRYVIDGLFHSNGDPINMNLIDEKSSDSYKYGVGAFINDAKSKDNNCCFDYFDSDKKSKDLFNPNPKSRIVYVKALRDIEKGEELFVSYGKDYWTKK